MRHEGSAVLIRPFLGDLLLANVLILASGTALLGLPARTGLILVVLFDLFCLLTARSRSILAGYPYVRELIAERALTDGPGFNRAVLGGGACLTLLPTVPATFASSAGGPR